MRFKESPGKALLEVHSLSSAHRNSELIFRVRPSVCPDAKTFGFFSVWLETTHVAFSVSLGASTA